MYPVTPTYPLHERPSPLPRALPHLMDAVYAELDSVTRLLETRSPSARDLDDITHLIKVAAAFRERLQRHSGHFGPIRQELKPIPSTAFHSSREPIYTSTPLHETPCYLQGQHVHDKGVLPPTPDSLHFAPDPKRTIRRGSKHRSFLNIVFRPLIALVGPTKGRNLTPSCHCLELSRGDSHG